MVKCLSPHSPVSCGGSPSGHCCAVSVSGAKAGVLFGGRLRWVGVAAVSLLWSFSLSLSAFTMLISFSSTLSFFCLPLPSLPCPCILYKRERGQHRAHIHTRSDPHKLTRQKNTRQRRGEAPFKKRGERQKNLLGLSSHFFFVAFVALSIGEL